MNKSKWLIIFFWIFYAALIGVTIMGLVLNGISDIKATIFYFVLLGLFCLPLLINFIPSLESFNILGVEVKFKKELEKTQKYVKDLEKLSDDRIRDVIFRFVKEEHLTDEGKRIRKELQEEIDEK